MEYGNVTDGFDAAAAVVLAGMVIDLGLLECEKDALDATFLDRGKDSPRRGNNTVGSGFIRVLSIGR